MGQYNKLEKSKENFSTMNSCKQEIGQLLPNWKPPIFPPSKPIDGSYCHLEVLDVEKHAKELFAANGLDKDGRNWTYLPYGPFTTFEEYHRWLKTICGSKDPLFFAVIPKDSGKACGIVSYLRIAANIGSIEVGHIHFSEILKCCTAATEAMFLMMENAFNLGYRRYEWKCDALNKASCIAAQRLGFSFEGIFRQERVYKGRNRDTAWFSIIDDEWPMLRKAFLEWFSPINFDIEGKQYTSLSTLTAPFRKDGPVPLIP